MDEFNTIWKSQYRHQYVDECFLPLKGASGQGAAVSKCKYSTSR